MKNLLLIFLVIFCSCSAKLEQKLNYNPSEPLRVVILPFVGGPDLGSADLDEKPESFVQTTLAQEFGKTNLDLSPQYLVNSKLVHAGVRNEQLKIDAVAAQKLSPKDICEGLFSCDAVVYGTVSKWDRSYYGIQSVATVGIDFSLVSARDGKILFQSKGEDSDSRGISKIPTGFSDLVIEPIKGLDREVITDLARRLISNLIKPLLASSRPEFMNTMPPAIFAAAHDSLTGEISESEPLIVLVYGSQGKNAFFSIGNTIENIPMIEQEPGHYLGVFYPLATDSFSDLPVSVTLIDEFGRVAQQNMVDRKVNLRVKGA